MARKPKGRVINGWLAIDKPAGPTSTQVLGQVKRLTGAAKAGHGGTLDPIATGVLPIAFGEATKTVSYVMDGTKHYRFTLRWGEARSTDDCMGEVVACSELRPGEHGIRAALPAFLGAIQQVPPQFSAIKVAGERAYDLARAGETVALEPRQVQVDRFDLIDQPDADHATFEVVCGKGTYMRSLARDLAQALGGHGHITALRRLAVGRFTVDNAISLDALTALGQGADLNDYLLPLETALDDIPALALTVAEAHRMRQGQPVSLFRRPDLGRLDQLMATMGEGSLTVLATAAGAPLALALLEGAELRPVRILNL